MLMIIAVLAPCEFLRSTIKYYNYRSQDRLFKVDLSDESLRTSQMTKIKKKN